MSKQKTKRAATQIQIGHVYILYGKTPDMTRFMPITKDRFVRLLFYAGLYHPKTAEDVQQMQKELEHLNNSDQGKFEFRCRGKTSQPRK